MSIKHRNPAPTTITISALIIPPQVLPIAPTTAAAFPTANILLFDFPALQVEGNDDPNAGDENNNPYGSGKTLIRYTADVGVVASADWPTGPGIEKLAGQVGEELSESVKFETFVRINAGQRSATGEWLKISDPIEWMVIQKFKRTSRGMEDNGSVFQPNHAGF